MSTNLAKITWLICLLSFSVTAYAVEKSDAHEALERINQRDYRGAIERLDRLSPEEQNRLSACYLRGFAFYSLKEYEKAFTQFEASKHRNETAPALRFFLRGYCGLETKHVPSALRDFAAYASDRSDERDVDLRIVRTILLSENGREEAMQMLFSPDAEQLANPWHLLWRGIVHFIERDLRIAESNLSKFLTHKPRDERGLFWRCRIRNSLNCDAEAVTDYVALLRINSVHAGGFEEKSASRIIQEPGDISYGRQQIERLLHDRPKMGRRFDPNNPLHAWVAWRFQQKFNSLPIKWMGDFDRDKVNAYHSFRRKENAWCIFVSDTNRKGKDVGIPRNADELWDAVLFELENVANRPHIERLRGMARKGQITRRDFVLDITQLEWQASLRKRAFYTMVYFPWAQEAKMKPTFDGWYEDGITFKDFLESLSGDEIYPWQVYGRQYDLLRSHSSK